MFTIDPDKVCHIIVKARALDAQMGLGDPTEETGASYDGPGELGGAVDDATQEELAAFIAGLNEDEQVELVALTWVGRGSFAKEEWAEVVREARHAHNARTADYLLGLPLLGDYLADGLAEFGHGCDG